MIMGYIFLCILLTILGIFGTHSAYYNGVNDGYLVNFEPDNPGYQKAKEHLKSIGKYPTPTRRVKDE